MFRTTLAVSVIAASLCLAIDTHASISMNGRSLSGCQDEGICGTGYRRPEHQTGAPWAQAKDADPLPEEAAPLAIEAFLYAVPANGTSLDGVSPTVDMEGMKPQADARYASNDIEDTEPSDDLVITLGPTGGI